MNLQKYDELENDLRGMISKSNPKKQIWIGLVGAPGSGKSTLASELKKRLGKLLTVIPMDGYHYYCSELEMMENSIEAVSRRGAPFTFNSTKFVGDLINSYDSGEGVFPSFDHSLGDPIQNQIYLTQSHKLILVEGNYLLLNSQPWCQLREKIFDETWFLNISIEESNKRVKNRLIKLGLTNDEAESRVKNNDEINAKLVIDVSKENASKIIHIPSYDK